MLKHGGFGERGAVQGPSCACPGSPAGKLLLEDTPRARMRDLGQANRQGAQEEAGA